MIYEMEIIKYISLGFCKDHKDVMQGKSFTWILYADRWVLNKITTAIVLGFSL